MPLEGPQDGGTLVGIIDFGITWVGIERDLGFLEHVIGWTLICRLHESFLKAEAAGDRMRKAARVLVRGRARAWLGRDETVLPPDRYAVPAPEQREGPARQRLARIPFALAVMQKAARCEAIAQAADEIVPRDRLVGPNQSVFHSGDTAIDSRRSIRRSVRPPHRETHIVRRKLAIDPLAESPSASSAAQDSMENGSVSRGFSAMRVTFISNENSTPAGSITPLIGAAEV